MSGLKRNIYIAAILIAMILGCKKAPEINESIKIGFDVDDTLLFSTPAFKAAFESGAKPYSPEFWEVVNSKDAEVSIVKQKTLSILRNYMASGADIYVITARHPDGGNKLRDFLHERMAIARNNVYFETEGKEERLRDLGIDVFYGDSDSDIIAAREAGAKPYRIMRSTSSSYQKNYHPGQYGEEIVEDSEW